MKRQAEATDEREEQRKKQRVLHQRDLEERKARREKRKARRDKRKARREFEERKAQRECLRGMPVDHLVALIECERARLERERAHRTSMIASLDRMREVERQLHAYKLRTRIRELSKHSVTLENQSSLEHALLAWFRPSSEVFGFAAQWKVFVDEQLVDSSNPARSTIKSKLWDKLVLLGVNLEGVSTVISNLDGITGKLDGKARDGSVFAGVGPVGGCDVRKEIAGTVAFLMELNAVMDFGTLPDAIKVLDDNCNHVFNLTAAYDWTGNRKSSITPVTVDGNAEATFRPIILRLYNRLFVRIIYK
jgi:hypothetical protein